MRAPSPLLVRGDILSRHRGQLRGAKQMAYSYIIVSGGFHNVAPRRFRLPTGYSLQAAWDAREASQDPPPEIVSLWDRVAKHLCGVQGCLCGGRGAHIVEAPHD